MTDLVDQVYEQIQEAEQRKAAVEAELEALNEIHEIARTKLNGEALAAPMRPRQHDATRSERRTGAKKQKTSTRRPPAPPREKPGTVDRAQAPAGGGNGRTRYDYSRETIAAKAREVFASASGPISASEVSRCAGYPDKNDRAIAAFRHAILDLIGEAFIVEGATGRGGHPRYVLAPAAPFDEPVDGAYLGTGEFMALLDRIVRVLETDDGRVARADLRDRCGNPEFSEFEEALNSLLTDKRIARVQAGGVAGYELA